MLVLSELFWILLYSAALLIAILSDDIQVLSLSLFFLIFSAVEISTGLAILTFQLDTYNTLAVTNQFNKTSFKTPSTTINDY